MKQQQEEDQLKGAPVAAESTPIAAAAAAPDKELPPLSRAEFQMYNHMASHMNQYHESFRRIWTKLYSASAANKQPADMSVRQLLRLGLQFCQSLTVHHTIEEVRIFPVLAEKMECFRTEHEMLTQHHGIHAGVERLEGYLEECYGGEREVVWAELKEIMDGFGEVLWAHLDAEVKALGAENMRLYWSLEEMAQMPF